MSTTQEGYVAQHGGTHYQSELQHWDFIVENGIGYLEGCASKYVTRTRKKDGLNDLKKAITYIDKIIAKGRQGFVRPPYFARWIVKFIEAMRIGAPVSTTPPLDFAAYGKANDLTQRELLAFRLVCDWRSGEDLVMARTICEQMIAEIEAVKARIADQADPQL